MQSVCTQVLHRTGSSCQQLIMWFSGWTFWYWQDRNHQRHGQMSRKIRCRLWLLEPDRRPRAGTHS